MRCTFTPGHPDCVDTRAILDAYLASGDRLEARPTLARHLEVCAECHARYAEALIVAARRGREQRVPLTPPARPAKSSRSAATNRERMLFSVLVLVLVARFDPLDASSRLGAFAGQMFELAYNALQGNVVDGGHEVARPTQP